MAEKKGGQKATKDAKEPKGGGNKVKLIVLILIVLVVLGLAGGAAWWFLFRSTGEDPEQAQTETATEQDVASDSVEKEGIEKAPLIYHGLDAITVNLSAPGPVRFLRVSITVASRDEAVIKAVEKHLPMIRNDLLGYLSAQEFEVINTPEGKNALRTGIKDIITRALGKSGEQGTVEDVLFTDLVMQ